MKKILVLLSYVFLTSCASASYYQLYKASPTDKSVLSSNSQIVYEDENCKVFYNFWGEKGDFGFRIYNKTDKSILVDMSDSFFVINGISNNYYKERVYSYSNSSGIFNSRATTSSKSVSGVNNFDLFQTNRISATNSSQLMSSNEYTVSYAEEKIVTIPSKTSKIISEYKINDGVIRFCDLLLYPSKKEVTVKSFDKDSSPLVFTYLVTYYLDGSEKKYQIKNEFYISELSNLPESEMLESRHEENCGKKSMYMTKHFKKVSADKFYIKY